MIITFFFNTHTSPSDLNVVSERNRTQLLVSERSQTFTNHLGYLSHSLILVWFFFFFLILFPKKKKKNSAITIIKNIKKIFRICNLYLIFVERTRNLSNSKVDLSSSSSSSIEETDHVEELGEFLFEVDNIQQVAVQFFHLFCGKWRRPATASLSLRIPPLFLLTSVFFRSSQARFSAVRWTPSPFGFCCWSRVFGLQICTPVSSLRSLLLGALQSSPQVQILTILIYFLFIYVSQIAFLDWFWTWVVFVQDWNGYFGDNLSFLDICDHVVLLLL